MPMPIQQQRQHAINLNNKAAFFMQIERPIEALKTLRQASSVLHRERAMSSISDRNNRRTPPQFETTPSTILRQTAEDDGHLPLIITPSIRSIKLPCDHEPTTSLPSSCCSDTSYARRAETLQLVFDRALIVSITEQSDDLISATIFYNAALVHHVHGLDQGKSDYLSKALRLYQTALLLVLTRSCSNQSYSSTTPTGITTNTCHSVNLLILALLNNSTQIHAMLFHRELVAESLDYMRCVLDNVNTVSSSHDHCEDNDNDDDDNDYSFFYLNALCCSEHLLNVAPAA